MLSIFPSGCPFFHKRFNPFLSIFRPQVHGHGLFGEIHGIVVRLIYLGIKCLLSDRQDKRAGFGNLIGFLAIIPDGRIGQEDCATMV